MDLTLIGRTSGNPIKIPEGPSSFNQLFEEVLSIDPQKEALVHGKRRFSYKELDSEANKAANLFVSLGIEKSDRIAVSMPNCPEIVIAFLGAMRIGAIWVGLSMKLTTPEKVHLLNDSGAKLFLGNQAIASQVLKEKVNIKSLENVLISDLKESPSSFWLLMDKSSDHPSDIRLDPYSPAAIAYTSGTTGFPKGAVHSQHNMLLSAKMVRPDMVKGRPTGVCLPLTILNLMIHGPLAAFVAGDSLVIMESIGTRDVVQGIKEERVAHFSAVPTIIYDLLHNDAIQASDLENYIHPAVGGADCTELLKQKFKECFGRELLTGYGLTEAPGMIVCEKDGDVRKPGSSGRPLPHVKIHILDETGTLLPPGKVGEVCIGSQDKGPWTGVYRTMLGYWSQPDLTGKTVRDGLLYTGDMGELDEDGYLFIKDRKKDMIIRGGGNIYPAEVERILMSYEYVNGCAVIGKPHDRLGEIVVAFIEVCQGKKIDSKELDEFCENKLASYKIPEEFIFVDVLPRNSMGKVIKGELKKEIEALKTALISNRV